MIYNFQLPETKGKTLHEIEDYFSGKTSTLKTKRHDKTDNLDIILNNNNNISNNNNNNQIILLMENEKPSNDQK